MTTHFDQPSIDFDAVSEPISGETKATVELVGNDWGADEDWQRFVAACYEATILRTRELGQGEYADISCVDPNEVRALLTNGYGLTIEPRRYSAFWSRAAGKNGFLVADGWVTNDDAKGGNRGKPLRRYRLRSAS